jgi:hypothetical protein
MKKRLVLLALLVSGFAPFTTAQTPSGDSSPAAPAKSGAARANVTPKKESTTKDAPKIAGTVLTRPDGTFLGLTLVEGKFKLSFYDKERKPRAVDVLRATARWPNLHGPGQNRAVLIPAGDGTHLLAPQFVRGPYAFKLFLTLVKSEDGAEPTENYTVDFRG